MRDKNKLVSCIITTCNRENLLARAIESVLNQTYKNIELIVIDDCPCIETEKVVKKFLKDNSRMQYIRNEKNLGPMGSRNKAVAHVSGEYIAFLDDDDYWVKDKLNKQVGHCERYSFVSCLALIDDSKNIRAQPKRNESWELSLEDAFMSTSNVFPSGLLLKKENFMSVGGFDVKLVEHDFFYKLMIEHGSAYIINEGLVVFNRDPQLERVSNNIEPYIGLLAVLLKYRHVIDSKVLPKKLASVYFGLYKRSSGIFLSIGYLILSLAFDKNIVISKILSFQKYLKKRY